MKKILFLIHDLGGGGAEKVLVNLVNHMDRTLFEIHVTALFGGGTNEQFLKPDIHYRAVWNKMLPGNSKLMKLLTPRQLHRLCVKEHYDIEVSYLEGPAARVISGCEDPKTKLVSWIHVEQHTMKTLAGAFRSAREAEACYRAFHNTICVSEYVKKDFCSILCFDRPCEVLYNTVESEQILEKARHEIDFSMDQQVTNLIAVGTLKQSKGYMRLLNIMKRLREHDEKVHLYILGRGPLQGEMERFIREHSMEKLVTLLGYDTNPYQYIARADLFVCASFSEGFSTAATEALIVGTPVCTAEVSGMKEMLGENDEYGIVTENSEEALYEGIKRLLDDPALLAHYRKQAALRGEQFSTEKTVKAVEDMLLGL